MITPNPNDTTWELWAATVAGYNPGLDGQLHPIQGWQRFGEQLALSIPGAPMPQLFESWQPWARALKQVTG